MATTKRNLKRFCPMCNYEIDAGNFFISKNPHHGGYLLYCKDHCNQIYKEHLSFLKNNASAMWFTCAELGIPFVNDIFKKYEENKQAKINKMKSEINPATGRNKYTAKDIEKFINNYKDLSFYMDLLRKTNEGVNDWSSFRSGTDVDYKDVTNNNASLDVVEAEKKQYIQEWGLQDNIEDYQFLDAVFREYTNGVEFENFAQKDLYRDLCRDRLLLRKINDGRYNGDESIDKVQNRIAKLMNTLKVDQFKTTKPKTISEQLLFAKIAQIEQTQPADLYKEPKKYKDFNKLRTYYKDMVLRPLLNTLAGHRDFDIDLQDVEKYNLETEDD